MKNKVIFLSFVILFGFATSICTAKYSGGDGSEATPYRISDANDMQQIGANPADWDKHFVLTDNVNLAQFTGTQFNIIGNDSNAFTGVFDGNGFTISNFTYNSLSWRTGIFGTVGNSTDPNAVIKDLTLINPNVNTVGRFGGSLIGFLFAGIIINCCVEDVYISGKYDVGGLLGHNATGTILSCHATGNVEGFNSAIGGLVGSNRGLILSCFASGIVQGSETVGGLVGFN